MTSLRLFNSPFPGAVKAALRNSGSGLKTNVYNSPPQAPYLFLSLTQTGKNAEAGIYSMRAVVDYTAKVASIRRSSDNVTADFYADVNGNLTKADSTSFTSWLGAATAYMVTWYDQSPAGQHMTAVNSPAVSTASLPYSIVFTGTEYFQNSIPFTTDFGSSLFTIRYVISNNTGGVILFKAANTSFDWSTADQKKLWLGDGTTEEMSRGGWASQVGNSEGYTISGTNVGSAKIAVTHHANGISDVPIYYNGVMQVKSYDGIYMQADPGTYLFFGSGGQASNYIGSIHEIFIFSPGLEAADRYALDNLFPVIYTSPTFSLGPLDTAPPPESDFVEIAIGSFTLPAGLNQIESSTMTISMTNVSYGEQYIYYTQIYMTSGGNTSSERYFGFLYPFATASITTGFIPGLNYTASTTYTVMLRCFYDYYSPPNIINASVSNASYSYT
jgi:hypothetical protein